MKELILVDLKKNPNVNDKMLIENAPLSSDEIMKYNSINNFLLLFFVSIQIKER